MLFNFMKLLSRRSHHKLLKPAVLVC